MATRKSGPGAALLRIKVLRRTSRYWRAERLVEAAAVDRRYFRSHGSEISYQLAAMVNHVVVQEAEIQHGRQIEDAEKRDGRHQLLRRHRRYARQSSLQVLVVPRDYFSRSLRLVLGIFHVEFQIGNSAYELHVGVGDVPGQVFRRA